jgi:hypothetical protein
MAVKYTIKNRVETTDSDGLRKIVADVVYADGTVERRRVWECSRCGRVMRPGSMNEGEGYHIDGCEGY